MSGTNAAAAHGGPAGVAMDVPAAAAAPVDLSAIQNRPPIETNWRDFEPEEDEVILANIAANAQIVTGISVNKNILLPIILRDRGLDKSEAAGIASKKSGEEQYAQAELMLEDINTLVNSCMGKKVVECLRGAGTLRDAFEKANPQQQCNNTIGSVEWGVTPCWICGSVIPNMSVEEERVHTIRGKPDNDKRKHPLSPECEHVFPVAQALCFTGLYEHELFTDMQKTAPTKKGAYIEGLKKEYRWAHRICNQVKNDTHFIKIEGGHPGEAGKFTYNNDTARILLQSILESGEYQWPPLPNTKKQEVDKFARVGRTKGGVIITNHLGGRRTPEWIRGRIVDIGKQVIPILEVVASKPPHQHAQETVRDFQAYAILKGCEPTSVGDVVPVTIYSEQYSPDRKNYPDIFTRSYLDDLTTTGLDRIHSLCVQALLKKVTVNRALLPSKQTLLELLGAVTDNLNENATMAYTVDKQRVATFLLSNGIPTWQAYQKVYYLMYCMSLVDTIAGGLDDVVAKPGDETIVYETIREALKKEKASLSGFINEAIGRPINPMVIVKTSPDQKYSETFKRWGIGNPSRGGTRSGRRKDRRKTHRRRKLPKLL